MSAERYIEKLVLAERNVAHGALKGPSSRTARSATRGFEAPVPSGGLPATAVPPSLKAAVDVGSLLSFVDGVGEQQKDDVLLSVQLAQRGASGAFDRFTQTESWYAKYVEILETVGWVVEQMAFARYDQSQGELRMDKAALAVIAAIATQNQLAVLQESLKALESLAEGDGTIRLFDFHTAAEASGNFQIGAVQKAGNDALSLALGAFHYAEAGARRRFLFVSWGAQRVDFWTAAQKLTFNLPFYAGRREAVRRKLGASADDFIAGLAIR